MNLTNYKKRKTLFFTETIHSLFSAIRSPQQGALVALITILASCARMGAPDGGWYDETPPRVVGSTPGDKETNVNTKRVTISFDEYIKIENASEKVVISPPQQEQPNIRTLGRNIIIDLKDTLKESTTYTIDFSDAIVDNNEGNPMGNYTYSFSTGEKIDTMECSGYVVNADNLEPVKGMLVGLYPASTDSMPATKPFLRVSRTDSRGHFVIRGIAKGKYTVGALQDMDGDYCFSQKGEIMAFSTDTITPHSYLDYRQDTVWIDNLHIRDIHRKPYTHFLPDNIILRSFAHQQSERYYLKHDRTEPDHFTLFFTAPVYPDSLVRFNGHPAANILPKLRLLEPENADEDFTLYEHSAMGDTVTYWLRDTALVNTDTLRIEMTTLISDTLGTLQVHTDTLQILPKTSLAKRLKKQEEVMNEWNKDVERKKKARERHINQLIRSGEEDIDIPEIDSIMPPEMLIPKYGIEQSMSPNGNITITFPKPIERLDTTCIHLYVEQDSLWFRSPMTIQPRDSMPTSRNWEVFTEWIPGANYSFEIDTLAFEDIYGHVSAPMKSGIVVKALNDYASFFVDISGVGEDNTPVIVQLLSSNDQPLRTETATNGTAEFYYVEPGNYFMRAIIDTNGNGKWDTGNYYTGTPPEMVYYYPEKIECKAKWDYTKRWNLNAIPLHLQKPADITKQKADKQKSIKHRNAERAQQKGVELPGGL